MKKLLLTKEILELNPELKFNEGEEVEISNPESGTCPPDPPGGYYTTVGGQCVLVKNS